jgi:hypothetical protein
LNLVSVIHRLTTPNPEASDQTFVPSQVQPDRN